MIRPRQNSPDRTLRRGRRLTMQQLATLLLSLVFGLAVGVASYLFLRAAEASLQRAHRDHAISLGRAVAFSAEQMMAARQIEPLSNLAARLLNDQTVDYVVFYNELGRFMAGRSSDVMRWRNVLEENSSVTRRHTPPGPLWRLRESRLAGAHLEADTPVILGPEHPFNPDPGRSKLIGSVRVGLSLESCRRQLQLAMWRTVGTAVLLVALAMPLTHLVVRRNCVTQSVRCLQCLAN